MKQLKVMTIIGTRPDIIKLSEIIRKCDHYFEHVLVHTGQNYDYTLNEIFFKDLGLRNPDEYLNVVGDNLGATIGNIIAKAYSALQKHKPDALLVLGDTNSSLCTIAAKRLKIPIFHLEAGNRCFDENLPEEINRRIVDHISDINLAYSEYARRYLINEGIKKEYTFVVGSPMPEVLEANYKKISNSKILLNLGLKEKNYIVLSAHREENIDNEKNLQTLIDSINKMAYEFAVPIIYSMHPRSKKRIEEKGISFHNIIRAIPPLSFTDYIHLQMESMCVVSDSGTLAEEASCMHFPAVSIRTSTERPEAIEKGNFILGTISSKDVIQSVQMAIKMSENGDNGSPVPDYFDTNVSSKVVKIIQSYTDIVNNNIWKKY